jgi:hypothetical protein
MSIETTQQMSDSAIGSVAGCTVYDVNAHTSLGKVNGDAFTAKSVESHGSMFLTLSDCE